MNMLGWKQDREPLRSRGFQNYLFQHSEKQAVIPLCSDPINIY